MNRSFLSAFAILAVALSMVFASNAEANNCNPPVGVSAETVAWAWGSNSNGQLGDGTTDERHTPVRVLNLSGVTAIAAGGGHSLALENDGTGWAWGLNSNGQLGDGTTTYRPSPVQVQNLSGVTAMDGGFLHSLALKNDGTVWAWGWNSFGQLGDGTTIDRNTPVQVKNLSGVKCIATGWNSSLALKNDGTLWTWGSNGNGQLGDGTTIDRNTPVQVQNLSGVTAMDAGASHSLALKNDGTVWAWGLNQSGELGDGTTDERHTPVQVVSGDPLTNPLSGIKAIAAGGGYSLAVKTDGTVRAWGANFLGQLGDGTTTIRHTPVQVQNLSGVTAITADTGHSLALRTIGLPFDGIVQAWGWNINGGLGDGTTIDRPYPVQVENLSGVEAIAVGTSHSVALGTRQANLTVRKILVHPDHNHLRLFNLRIDGVVVLANVNGGSTGPQLVSPGNHTVDETGGTGTHLGAFFTVIGGDCAPDGTVSLALGDHKTCTITNYDNVGGCGAGICCEPGDGTQECRRCSGAGHGCPP